jgi:hypothetical protein
MWEPRRLIILWTSTACCRDSFAFTSHLSLQSSRIFPDSSGSNESIAEHSVCVYDQAQWILLFTCFVSGNESPVGFEVFTAVTMKNAVFWGVAPCRCDRLNRRFGGSYRLYLQGRKIRERRTSVPNYYTGSSLIVALDVTQSEKRAAS